MEPALKSQCTRAAMLLHRASAELREQTARTVQMNVREQFGIVMCVVRLDASAVAQLLSAPLQICSPSVLPTGRQFQRAHVPAPFSLDLQVQTATGPTLSNYLLVYSKLVGSDRVALEIELNEPCRLVTQRPAERAAFDSLHVARRAPDPRFETAFRQGRVKRTHQFATRFVEALQVRAVLPQYWIVSRLRVPRQDLRRTQEDAKEPTTARRALSKLSPRPRGGYSSSCESPMKLPVFLFSTKPINRN